MNTEQSKIELILKLRQLITEEADRELTDILESRYSDVLNDYLQGLMKLNRSALSIRLEETGSRIKEIEVILQDKSDGAYMTAEEFDRFCQVLSEYEVMVDVAEVLWISLEVEYRKNSRANARIRPSTADNIPGITYSKEQIEAIIGVTVEEAVAAYDRAGKPGIAFAQASELIDMSSFLGNSRHIPEHLEAVRVWLKEHVAK